MPNVPDAKENGRLAHAAGVDIAHNPYPNGSKEKVQWENGWRSAAQTNKGQDPQPTETGSEPTTPTQTGE